MNRTTSRSGAGAGLAVLLLLVGPAAAVAQTAAGQTTAADQTAQTEPVAAQRKGGDPPGTMSWKARIFARAATERITRASGGIEARGDSLRLTLPSARIGLEYQLLPRVSMEIEGDLADNSLIKDAFVHARSKRLRARAGQFKMPLSAITLESPWTLPVARRGIIQDLLEDRMSLVGRRPGFLVSVRGGGGLDPELSLSAFQGSFLTGDAEDTDVEPLETGLDAQNLVARLSVTPGGQELALHGERVSTNGFQGRRRHFWAGGADATLDDPFGARGLRAWLEVLAGQTFYIDNLTARDATFASARAIVARRWGGREQGAAFAEPFAQAGLLDPDLDGGQDRLVELVLGVNVGWWRTFRATVQVERGTAGRQLPGQLFFGNLNLVSHEAALMQIGVAF
jgi:hypothetical protein